MDRLDRGCIAWAVEVTAKLLRKKTTTPDPTLERREAQSAIVTKRATRDIQLLGRQVDRRVS
jgi:hypothetical protein